MGKKKQFLNKKQATTYSLVYRTAEEEAEEPEGPDRILVPIDEIGQINPDADIPRPSSSRYPPGHPLAHLFPAEEDIPEQRRRDIVELGLPDDGYDYLKHLRVSGQGRASLSLQNAAQEDDDTISVASTSATANTEPNGPAVFIPAPTFVPPEVDVKLLDSRALAVEKPAADDEEAARRLAGVTAFSRQPQKVAGAMAAEVEELQQSMKALELVEEEVEEEDGYGEWLDEFVLTATQPAEGESAGRGAAGVTITRDQMAKLSAVARATAEAEGSEEEEDDEDYSEGDEDEEEESEEEDEEADRRGKMQNRTGSRAGSIASTVWSRPERHDRNAQLGLIDECFEQLAGQYEEDLIGELDEDVNGGADVNDFADVLDDFLAATSDATLLDGPAGPRQAVQPESKTESLEQFDPVVIARTKEAMARLAEREASSSGRTHEDLSTVRVAEQDPGERWDCESVLSLRSNTEHHPSRISEPRRIRNSSVTSGAHNAAPGIITLSQKSGLPSGYGLGGSSVARQAALKMAIPEEEVAEAPKEAIAPARPKGESSEQKKLRKTAVKEAKKVARENKKGLKLIFKEAAGQHKKLMANMGPSGTVTIPIS